MEVLEHLHFKKMIQRNADGLLNAESQHELEMHLAECKACSLYAAEIYALEGELRKRLQAHWDQGISRGNKSPSQPNNRTMDLLVHQRRRVMNRRIFDTVVIVALVIVLLVGTNFILVRFSATKVPVGGSSSQNNRTSWAITETARISTLEKQAVTSSSTPTATLVTPSEPPSLTNTPVTLLAPSSTPEPTSIPPEAGWEWFEHETLHYRIAHPPGCTTYKVYDAQDGFANPPGIQSRIDFYCPTLGADILIDVWDLTKTPEFNLIESVNNDPVKWFIGESRRYDYNATILGLPAIYDFYTSGMAGDNFGLIFTDKRHVFRILWISTDFSNRSTVLDWYLKLLESFTWTDRPGGEFQFPSLASLTTPNPNMMYTATIPVRPPGTCPVTQPPNPPFTPSDPSYAYPGTDFWYGADSLWTRIPENGIWYGLPHNPEGYTQKVFWWRKGYDAMKEPEPNLTVTGRRLDAQAPPLVASRASNAFGADIGDAMLVGVDFPTLGCWEITGQYGDAKLSFVIWVAP